MLAEIIWDQKTLSIAMTMALPLVFIIGMTWYKIVRVTSLNDLKRAMVNRGMSADEIERVLVAGRRQVPKD